VVIGDLREGDPILSDMREIAAAAERATQLTRQLLAFSRKQLMQPRVLDLSAHVREMDKMLRRLIGENVELVVEAAPDLDLVKVDPGQLEQVILNLVINARDAMPQGGTLLIETANAVLDREYATDHVGVISGPHVVLIVSDTGQGMEHHVRERIFEPFFTTKEGGRGTGLGLATVFGIVQQSGGHIFVYSEPGRGTTFKVYFPRCEERAPAVAVRSSRAPRLRGNETILLVEDEELVLTFAARALRRQGYDVLEAKNGGEALLIAERHAGRIHLLLTDVVMPKMGGHELAQRLKALRPDLMVLYMSGYTENTIVHNGVLDSGVELLEKPLRPEVLLGKVRELLDR
jgi:two-component system cell cycle sensor histidine kinase/response regulator CckA